MPKKKEQLEHTKKEMAKAFEAGAEFSSSYGKKPDFDKWYKLNFETGEYTDCNHIWDVRFLPETKRCIKCGRMRIVVKHEI